MISTSVNEGNKPERQSTPTQEGQCLKYGKARINMKLLQFEALSSDKIRGGQSTMGVGQGDHCMVDERSLGGDNIPYNPQEMRFLFHE